MEHNIDLIKQIREAYAKEEGYKSFASMALNVNIVPRDITEIAKRYAEGINSELQARCDKYEKERYEMRLAMRMLLKAFMHVELSRDQEKYYKQADAIFKKYHNITDALRNEALSGEGKDELFICPCCSGDGKETCTNPDHGFISFVGGETRRLGCPVCGHDPKHKIKNGGPCEICDGSGKVNKDQFNSFCNETGYDNEPQPIKEDKQ